MYNAFISYSHAADGKLAPALQNGLEKFAKPWYKLRNLNIFRDEASLSASPQLWPNIQKALDASEYLIYMASPVSASSFWVGKEIEYWIANKSLDKLLIVLTEGEIPWDYKNNSFLKADTNSLPTILDKKFNVEPFYIDLRTTRTQTDLSLKNPIFKKEILKLAAQLHNKEPKDLAGEEVTAHNKMIRIRNAAIGILCFLFIAAIGAAWIAVQNARRAVKERNTAQANYFASEAQRMAERDPTLALRLAEASMKQSNNSFIANIAQTIYRKNSFYRIIASLQKTENSYNSFSTVDYSPDGKYIVTGSGDGIPRLWEANGKLIRKFKPHSTYISSVGFSLDGKKILTEADSTIRLYDLNGNQLEEIVDHSGLLAESVIIPDIEAGESTISPVTKFWNVYGRLSQQFSPGIFSNNKIGISPDRKFIVTVDYQNEISISNVDGKPIHQFSSHQNFLNSIIVSPDGKNILTSSYDTTARLWDLSGKLLVEFRGHSAKLTSAIFSNDGKLVLTGAQDGTFKLWNTNGVLIEEFKGDFYGANCMDFSPDGKSILTGCDRTLRLWETSNPPLHEFHHNDQVSSVAFSPDGKTILTGSYDYTARLSDTTGKMIREFKGHSSIITAAKFSPDGNSVLTGSWDHTLRLSDLNGRFIHEFKDVKGTVSSVAFSPDGKFILSGADSTVQLWNINGTVIQALKLNGTISAVAFTPGGKQILVGNWDGPPELFDLKGNLIREYGDKDEMCSSLAISPDGKFVLTGGSGEFAAKLYTIEGKFIHEFLGHTFQIISVAFAPDGKSFLTGARDNSVRWWNVNGELIKEFKGYMGSVNSVAFSPDGKLILAGVSDNTARLWKTAISLEDFLKRDRIDPLTEEQKKRFGIK